MRFADEFLGSFVCQVGRLLCEKYDFNRGTKSRASILSREIIFESWVTLKLARITQYTKICETSKVYEPYKYAWYVRSMRAGGRI